MKKATLLSLLVLLVLSACREKDPHFLADRTYREAVIEQFENRKQLAGHRGEDLFSVFNRPDLSTQQREALQFLYAYMPLSDLADHDGDFFLKHVDAAFEARDFFSWGRSVPDEVFRHFVLPYRINNEDLDTARLVFFHELKDRVKDLSMTEAALEVNHWCHEKVTYRGTDGRTSAPLALVKTSWGRCGEESTFTATALRAIGIPARQVYTPRWVHTDSNHAWVEVWIDGAWKYLGACEPEAELNQAWFSAPAKRAMMMHTNVFGLYEGPEEKNKQTELYSVINLLANYAETRPVKVQVNHADGMPVEGAQIDFKVFNFAEFYPIATTETDRKGKAAITSGNGDLLVWANKDNHYGWAISTPNDDEVTIILNRMEEVYPTEEFALNVPPEQAVPTVPSDKVATNALRLLKEDSIRNAYMNTFITEGAARTFARQAAIDEDQTWRFLSLAQGNWRDIQTFMDEHKANPLLMPFLSALTQKDLRDTPHAVLSDHLLHADSLTLSPRISNELIRPWRSFFQNEFTADEMRRFRDNPRMLTDYVRNRLTVDDEANYYLCPISPRGVHELRVTDSHSRDIYFIALCRSMRIPARMNPQYGTPEFMQNGKYIAASFDEQSIDAAPANAQPTYPMQGVGFENDPDNPVKPQYGTHFSLAYFNDGDFTTINMGRRTPPFFQPLADGLYRLLVGSRANDGSVSLRTEYFRVGQENTTHVFRLRLPETLGKLFVKGIIDMNTTVETTSPEGKTTLKDLSNGKGLMLCFVDLGKEPSVHVLQDLPASRTALEEWSGGVVMMIPENRQIATFDASAFHGLPSQTTWAIDRNNALLEATCATLEIDPNLNFPLTLYLTHNGGVLFSLEGYHIGIGEDIVRTIHAEHGK